MLRWFVAFVAVALVAALCGALAGGWAVHAGWLEPAHLRARVRAVIGPHDDGRPNPAWPMRREQHRLFVRPADISMIGDSLTHAGHWDDMFPEHRIANYGIDGDRTTDILRRVGEILASRPRQAFLMAGTNDLAGGREVQATVADLVQIVERLRGEGVAVVLQSTLACRDCGARSAQILEVNERLRAWAADAAMLPGARLDWLDLNASLADADGRLRAELTYDGVHLNGAGYVAWRSAISPVLGPR